ncbi:sensor histidine kinase [Pseudodesulfovibrio piezophilus]|uniref:histidine kinase n=1 Tax=Pseudodesulfovibrio piezophilus (strain DSM 21447 / JCM 15486 / C1TLV30) TaxID=1322246 RepID=M1WM31_PSEP2|nr:HAMP domain-containing sensor histidine kinase [Pseudodesulfovibrio piezophilus]CCH48895.1 protein of unknown function [Pseudodesulfovibrio piezophilus C1TLV30]
MGILQRISSRGLFFGFEAPLFVTLWGRLILSISIVFLGIFFIVDMERRYDEHLDAEIRALLVMSDLRYFEEKLHTAIVNSGEMKEGEQSPSIARLQASMVNVLAQIEKIPVAEQGILHDVVTSFRQLEELEVSLLNGSSVGSAFASFLVSDEYKSLRERFKLAVEMSQNHLSRVHDGDENSGHHIQRNALLGGGILFLLGIWNGVFYREHRHVQVLADANKELKAAQEEAESAIQVKALFLASVSHEFRTPLNSILGFSQILTDRYYGELNEKQRGYVKDIEQSAQLLNEMVNEILALARVEAGRLSLDCRPVLPDEIVSRVLSLVKERALQCGIILSSDLERLPMMALDQNKIHQSILYLIDTSIRMASEGAHLHVNLESSLPPAEFLAEQDSRDWLSLTVTLSKTDVSHLACSDITEPFSGIHYGAGPGLGIGPVLAKKYAELHDGRVWCEKNEADASFGFHMAVPLSGTCRPTGEGREEMKNV